MAVRRAMYMYIRSAVLVFNLLRQLVSIALSKRMQRRHSDRLVLRVRHSVHYLPRYCKAHGHGVRQVEDEHRLHVLPGGVLLSVFLLQLLSGAVRVDPELAHLLGSGGLPLVLRVGELPSQGERGVQQGRSRPVSESEHRQAGPGSVGRAVLPVRAGLRRLAILRRSGFRYALLRDRRIGDNLCGGHTLRVLSPVGEERSGAGFIEPDLHDGDDGGVGGHGDGQRPDHKPSILPQEESECTQSGYRLLPRQSLRVC